MKQLITFTTLSIVGVLVWLLSYRLSPDALAMAIGLTFGLAVAGGVVLLVLASRQHQPVRGDDAPARNVYLVYAPTYDNRSVTLIAGPPEMPLLSDRQRELARR